MFLIKLLRRYWHKRLGCGIIKDILLVILNKQYEEIIETTKKPKKM